MTSTTYHSVIFSLPSAECREIELCIIPRVGETVWLNGLDYKVVRVINDIHKRGWIFGKLDMYINRITVVLEEA